MNMDLAELIKPLQGSLAGASVPVKRISIDTRTLQPGDLYIAIIGGQFDGHDFIAQAQKQGAAAVITSRPVQTALPCLQVADTRLALGQIAKLWRQRFNIPMLALTGSCGKTTTKTMLAAILQQMGKVLATAGTLNNDIGVPLTLLRLTPEHDFAVLELGANHPNEIGYLTALVQPQTVLITNAGPVHLEGFGDVAGVARGKGEILQGLGQDGTAILNVDDEHYAYWRDLAGQHTCISYGFNPQANVFAQAVQTDAQGNQQFILTTPQGEVTIQLAVLGRHNISNALAAAAASMTAGASLAQIKAGLEQVQPVDKRLNKRTSAQGAIIIDDTYNANPSAFQAALAALQQYEGEKILIAGDMAELGEQAEHYHTELGRLARTMGIQRLYAEGDLSRFTVAAFGQNGRHFSNKTALAEAVQQILHQGCVVLVKGSRSARMEQVVDLLVE